MADAKTEENSSTNGDVAPIIEEGASGPPYKYSREFLLAFKAKCTDEPEGLEHSECTASGDAGPGFGRSYVSMDNRGPPGSPMNRSMSGGDHHDKWSKNSGKAGLTGLQGLMPGSRGPRGGGPPGVPGGRGGSGGGYGGKWGKTSFPPQYRMDVQLHKTEHKYTVGQTKTDDPEEEKRQKEIKSVLNKLTPQNFDKLYVKLTEIEISSEKTLVGLIDQIFDKSLTEPTFCPLYAELCNAVKDKLPEFEVDGHKMNFRRVLLNKCQEEFEKGATAIQKARDDMNELENPSANTGDSKKEKGEDDNKDEGSEELEEGEVKDEKAIKLEKDKKIMKLREDEIRARRRMLGNVIFIGQLYMKHILTEKIMHGCIMEQLGDIEDPDPESVEALCKLMTTIGAQIDQPKSKTMMDEYFARLNKLGKHPKLESRIRFMIRDVIDLRHNLWKVRRKVEGPKKLSEVHKDAMEALSGKGDRRGDRRGDRFRDQSGGRFGGRNHMMGGGPPPHFENEGFVEYGKRPQSGLSGRPNMPLRLAPQGTFFQSGVKRDQGPHGKRVGDAKSASPADHASRSPGEGSRDHGSHGRVGESAKHGRGGPPSESTKIQTKVEPAMSDEDVRRKAEAIIKEFYSANDRKEVTTCVKELKAKRAKLSVLVEVWLSDLLEGRNRSVDVMSSLLQELATNGSDVLTKDDLHGGLLNIICTLEDIVLDAPMAPTMIASVLGDLASAGLVPLSILGAPLKKAFEEFTGEKDCKVLELEVYQDFVILVMKQMLGKKGASYQDVEGQFKSSKIPLPELTSEVIEKHGLQAHFSHLMYRKHVATALQGGADPAYLAQWFESHVDPAARNNLKLAPTSISDSLEMALSELSSLSLDQPIPAIDNKDHGLAKLYKKLLEGSDLDCELECVYALQGVNHDLKTPKGLMTRLLRDFFYSGVLSEDAFTKWRDDNKDTTTSKVKAISDATVWLNWLAEQGEQEEEDK